MMLLAGPIGSLLLPALAAPPSTEAEVDALLARLLDEDSAVRIAAANDLAATPPALTPRLDTSRISSQCAQAIGEEGLSKLPEACARWNHAMYHYIRVVGALARHSIDPAHPVGAWCIPRTQPWPGDEIETPACPMISRLRWIVKDGFGIPDLLYTDDLSEIEGVPELATELDGKALEATAREAYARALTPVLSDPEALARWRPWTAEAAGTRFSVLPICGGQAGFREECSFTLAVQQGERFATTTLLPRLSTHDAQGRNAEEVPGLPYANLRMTQTRHIQVSADGRYGLFATDYGCCDDRTRRIDVYDLKGAPQPVCHLEVDLVVLEGPVPDLVFPEVGPAGCRIP